MTSPDRVSVSARTAGGAVPEGAAAPGAAATADPWADARRAAVLLALDPSGLGGVRLHGAADARREHWLALLRAACPAGTPWQRMPLHIDDDRLLGGLDLGATLQRGQPVAQPGLLARCDGGFVLAAMAERMAPATAARLAMVLDTRQVAAPRQGLSDRAPARLAVVALDEGHGGDEAPPAALRERLGLQVDLSALPLPGARASALHADARTNPLANTPASPSLTTPTDAPTDAPADALADARRRLPAVRCDDAIVQALCEAAEVLGVASLRGPLFAVAAARAHAAWAGRDAVVAEDAAVAARLVLAPRATRLPQPSEPPAPPDEPSAPPEAADTPPDTSPDTPPPDPGDDASPQALADDEPLPDQVLQAALAAIPPGLLALLAAAAGRGPTAGGRAGALQASRLRGRPYGSRRGDPRGGARLHLIDTLRAAAPWQGIRRREAADAAAAPASGPREAASAAAAPAPGPREGTDATAPAFGPRVLVRRDDFHVSRFRQRRETTTLFVVDASGSAALHRLAEAKGAVELLLADCYVRRDKVALMAFRGQAGGGTELLLPPTRSLVRAKRCLAALPGGGGTPLASALDAARELTEEVARRGGTPLAVFLTDGRANIARDGGSGRERASADTMLAARRWQGSGVGALWLDTAPQPQPQAQQLALAMGARYLPLPHADAQQMSRAVQALR